MSTTNITQTLLDIIQPIIAQRLHEKLENNFQENVFNPNYKVIINEDTMTGSIDIGVRANGMIRLCEEHKDCNHENMDIQNMGFKIRLSREMILYGAHYNILHAVDMLADDIIKCKLLLAKEGECSRCNYQLRKLKE